MCTQLLRPANQYLVDSWTFTVVHAAERYLRFLTMYATCFESRRTLGSSIVVPYVQGLGKTRQSEPKALALNAGPVEKRRSRKPGFHYDHLCLASARNEKRTFLLTTVSPKVSARYDRNRKHHLAPVGTRNKSPRKLGEWKQGRRCQSGHQEMRTNATVSTIYEKVEVVVRRLVLFLRPL
jgi:hypothetical protein